MILAAGLGTRLRPLTDEIPKALVPVGGVPMLERIARRLVDAGADRLIINIHHHADKVRHFLEEKDGFGVEVRISEEQPAPLETGGGVVHAREHFREDEPFLVHNVDVICDVDLAALHRDHARSGALATLAVSTRESSRVLRFDDEGLQARVDRRDGNEEAARPLAGEGREYAFAGIHAISPSFFDLVDEDGVFSIIPPYLRLAGDGHRIRPYPIGRSLWMEVGTPERLEQARNFLRRGNGGGEG